LHELKLGDAGIAQALDFGEPCYRRGDHFRERAERRYQGFGKRLDVAPGLRAEQYRFQQFVVRQRVGTRLTESLAQALPMAVIVRRRFGEAAFVVALLFKHGNSYATPALLGLAALVGIVPG
jgi:hypothetical protein